MIESLGIKRDHNNLIRDSQGIDIELSEQDMNLLETVVLTQKLKNVTLNVPILAETGLRLLKIFR